MSTYSHGIHRWSRWSLPLGIILLSLLCSCGVVIGGGDSVEEPSAKPASKQEIARLGIPPGHLPPPGECRVWFPNNPPGHQPPPGDCSKLRHRVPAGAWLLHRDRNNPEQIEVLVFDHKKLSAVSEIRYFEVSSGRFLRAEHR
jgi:hypothetical protein